MLFMVRRIQVFLVHFFKGRFFGQLFFDKFFLFRTFDVDNE
ncbi:hypothetical protein BpHYR1_001982 [Brachionus plicatilis]|uniref:Uncharacterized protein n=1 Tax=Brachionus plicatilis TaxID=10195 RepID=A0A3M7R8C6_BRAPC|nr:hypothetical protein BpHYR1_001982 [Brachionus plicatilis]